MSKSKVAITRYLNVDEEPYKFTDRGLQEIRERLQDMLENLVIMLIEHW